MRAWLILALLAVMPAVPLAAQETRIAPADHVPPPASLDQLDWLVGQWAGRGIGGLPAYEAWLAPTGGTMVGTFVQLAESGSIGFTEHLYLMEEQGSLVLRLKHFNADLTGWEERDDMLSFRLIAVEACAAYFQALTLRCADRDNPGSGLVAAVRMKGDDPVPRELIFRFEAANGTVAARCADAMTTREMNECFAATLARADERRMRYLGAALERHAERPRLAERIATSDSAFTAYRDAECDAVLEDWIEGSIRGIMSLQCRIAMNDQRSLVIWQNWLTYPDGAPPVLPEPQPTS